ncbi:hypothetical protein LX36DRAFT_449398 [Colletotrichum falcatum]|nr:hypothetical protein LX36DRAFT_449398 [Colletotrichum falcatum]
MRGGGGYKPMETRRSEKTESVRPQTPSCHSTDSSLWSQDRGLLAITHHRLRDPDTIGPAADTCPCALHVASSVGTGRLLLLALPVAKHRNPSCRHRVRGPPPRVCESPKVSCVSASFPLRLSAYMGLSPGPACDRLPGAVAASSTPLSPWAPGATKADL